jgi:signal transduction histidine kinase
MSGIREPLRSPDLAEFLETHCGQILGEYERALRERGSRLVSDSASREQCLKHAGQILADVIASLRSCRVVIAEGEALAGEIGLSRAAGDVHPVESLQAATELFRIVIFAANSGPSDWETSALTLAAHALNESLMGRIQEAARSYVSFLIDKIYSAQVDERMSIGRELHDRVGSDLSIALRQLELHEMSDRAALAAVEPCRVTLAKQALVDAASDIREIITGLRLREPAGNLNKALSDYIASAAPDGVKAEVVINGDENWVPPTVQDEVFFVVREAMRNALIHGQGSVLLARVDIAPHELRATVDDNGVGFDPGGGGRRRGTGLPSMRERVTLLHGEFQLTSSPGMGTRIALAIPLQRKPAVSDRTSRRHPAPGQRTRNATG